MQRRPIINANDSNSSAYHQQQQQQYSSPTRYQATQDPNIYISPQLQYNLLDVANDFDDFDDDKTRRRRRRGLSLQTVKGFMFESKANAVALIFFLLFAWTYFKWKDSSAKYEKFVKNSQGSMSRFKELSSSREKRCLQSLEDREHDVGELRALLHEQEKLVELERHAFNECEIKLHGFDKERKMTESEETKQRELVESLRHEKKTFEIEIKKWKDEALSAKEELSTLKKHHALEKHDVKVKHAHDLIDSTDDDDGYNAVIDDVGVLHKHSDEEYEELKRAFEEVSKKQGNAKHKEFFFETLENLKPETKSSPVPKEQQHPHEPTHQQPTKQNHEPSQPPLHPAAQTHTNAAEHVASSDIPNHRRQASENGNAAAVDDDDNRPLWEKYANVAEEVLTSS